MSKHSAHLTSLLIGFCTLLWWHACLLLLILMLWHRQAISNRKETICLPLLNARFEAGHSETPNRQQTECTLSNRLSYEGSYTSNIHVCAFQIKIQHKIFCSHICVQHLVKFSEALKLKKKTILKWCPDWPSPFVVCRYGPGCIAIRQGNAFCCWSEFRMGIHVLLRLFSMMKYDTYSWSIGVFAKCAIITQTVANMALTQW